MILANYTETPSEIGQKKKFDQRPKFSFEFEFYNKKDPRYLIIQRYPVHYEDSEDILEDGKCVKVSLNDVKRFLDPDQVSETSHSSELAVKSFSSWSVNVYF